MEKRLYNLLKNDNSHICPICREYIQEYNQSLILPCGHLYCKNCFVDYSKLYTDCSLCHQHFNCLDHSNLYQYIQDGIQEKQTNLYEIMYFYFNINYLILTLLKNNPTVLNNLTTATNYFEKEKVENFIQTFLKIGL